MTTTNRSVIDAWNMTSCPRPQVTWPAIWSPS